MRCGTLRFGSVAVWCGAVICDRVRAKGPYGIEIFFLFFFRVGSEQIINNIQKYTKIVKSPPNHKIDHPVILEHNDVT